MNKILKGLLLFIGTFGLIALMFYWGFHPPGDWYYLFCFIILFIFPLAAKMLLPVLRIIQTSPSAKKDEEKNPSESNQKDKATKIETLDEIDDFTSIWLD